MSQNCRLATLAGMLSSDRSLKTGNGHIIAVIFRLFVERRIRFSGTFLILNAYSTANWSGGWVGVGEWGWVGGGGLVKCMGGGGNVTVYKRGCIITHSYSAV